MAEGGKDDEDNPFSFKKFVKKSKAGSSRNNPRGHDEEDFDIFDVPDVPLSTESHKSKKNQHVDKTKKKDDEGNPFSFKKFLQGQSSSSRPNTRSDSSGNFSSAPPDVASDLPDFVQDQFDRQRLRDRPGRDLELPDFALDTSVTNAINLPSPNIDHGSGTNSNPTIPLDIDPVIPLDINPPIDRVPVNGHVHAAETGASGGISNDLILGNSPRKAALPDFLSDSALGGSPPFGGDWTTEGLPNGDSIAYHVTSGSLELEVRRLQQENAALRQQLEDARQQAEVESRRVAKILKEKEATQKRESEETAALEKMVQQVEANLETTTQRAVRAESKVASLKQDVKNLQGQISSLTAENTALRSGDNLHGAMREKARYASEQIKAAATNAELSLKHLLGGVDSMKLVANMLAHIDMVTEQPPTGDSAQGHHNPGTGE
ncbi:serologically defined colon cancer antigen 3 homolog [Lingula anatina]|uniref:Endosome-associated-trafficking regulator 1 n=1 Tax=Lingula anatina TaxID=7574 RepID=A0A1S3IFX0_LINAN|nr:serologically defined colon cancer antigen 3 homolog [Lingula anatina]|eukprot:XP_013396761.1 serologically defined colon cancer antigen 3 homolog [Lingula anatina]